MKRTTETIKRRLVDLFPPIEPYNEGKLKVSDLHTIHYEECGNPKGKPVVFLHGGPGGGIDPVYRQYFNPKKWRIILFDQRGCGRSSPRSRNCAKIRRGISSMTSRTPARAPAASSKWQSFSEDQLGQLHSSLAYAHQAPQAASRR